MWKPHVKVAMNCFYTLQMGCCMAVVTLAALLTHTVDHERSCLHSMGQQCCQGHHSHAATHLRCVEAVHGNLDVRLPHVQL